MMEQTYKNKWDTFSGIISGLLLLFTLYIMYETWANQSMGLTRYLIIFLIAAYLVATWIYIPYKATTDGKEVIIHRIVGKETFTIDRYEAQVCPKSDFPSGVRILASSGFFGYVGKWRGKIGGQPRANYDSFVTSTSEDMIFLKSIEGHRRVLLNAPREWFGIE